MSAGWRWFVAGLLAGALVRGLLLPLPGTGDVVIWKVWSFSAAHDVTGMYGVGGSPPERRVLSWQGHEMTVDYPPLALYELGVVGRLYRAMEPLYGDSAWLTAAVKLPGLVAEIVLVVVLYRFCRRLAGEQTARRAVLAVWLNPAVLLDSSALGYLDSQMAVPAALAVLAAWARQPALAGVLIAAAMLTKAQAVFVLPVVLALVLRQASASSSPATASVSATSAEHAGPEEPRRTAGAAAPALLRELAALAAGGFATAAVLIVPFVARGAWSNLAQALSRLALHDSLSAQAPNIWWLFTWVLRVQDVWTEWGGWAALTQEVKILAISRAVELGYPNARVVGLVLVGAALGWACLKVWRVQRAADAAALAAWGLHAYALLAAQVHENHLAPAVLLFAPAAALAPAYRPIFWLLTAVVALNLYLFYGLGVGWPPIIGRGVTAIDATVVLSFVNLAAFIWFTATLRRRLV